MSGPQVEGRCAQCQCVRLVFPPGLELYLLFDLWVARRCAPHRLKILSAGCADDYALSPTLERDEHPRPPSPSKGAPAMGSPSCCSRCKCFSGRRSRDRSGHHRAGYGTHCAERITNGRPDTHSSRGNSCGQRGQLCACEFRGMDRCECLRFRYSLQRGSRHCSGRSGLAPGGSPDRCN